MARVRKGEGASVTIFGCYAFVLLVCYYALKTLREPLLLEDGSAEIKSYAYAAIALSLLVLVPLYGAVFRRTGRRQLLLFITVFFVVNLIGFSVAAAFGSDIGFVYYVWVGIFGVAMVAQFWAHAAHVFGVDRGQRLFPLIMVGAALGGLAGPLLHESLYQSLGTWKLILLVAALLLLTCPMTLAMRPLPRPGSSFARLDEAEGFTTGPALRAGSRGRGLFGGIALVLSDRYLLMLAVLSVLLNCINTTGEYLLADLVVGHADARVAADPSLEKDVVIGAFYAKYFFSVNALTVAFQLLLVGRLLRWVGVSGALLVLPVISIIGYGLIAFIPIFGVIRAVKIVENSIDYSLMNTSRHALYLPLPVHKKYEGKTAVDTFFWRLGDLVQAGVIYVGLNWIGLQFKGFAMLNIVLAVAWLFVAVWLGSAYRRRVEPRFGVGWRPLTAAVSIAAIAGAAIVLPTRAGADEPHIFDSHEPLAIELSMDDREFCRDPSRDGCRDTPAILHYTGADGVRHRIETQIRARGRWRSETGDCRLPALFVFFDQKTTAGTVFAGQSMLPLTTHCRTSSHYEQYLLKEYGAYRAYNELTDRSLRVRLVRVTYSNPRKPKRSIERYGFFVEHFDSLAARHDAELWEPEAFDPSDADFFELGTLTLFEYMIGNTDWSVIHGHNIALFRSPEQSSFAVAYDFDFSGLVDTEYSGPPPNLPIRDVRQRLFRGFCRDGADWNALFERFIALEDVVRERMADVPGLLPRSRQRVLDYVDGFFEILASADRREKAIVGACR